MIKKWWILVVVFGLALGLTSCSKKSNTAGADGWSQCAGQANTATDPGDFDIWVLPSGGGYEIFVTPVSVVPMNSGENFLNVSLALVRTGTAGHKLLQDSVSAVPYQQISAGWVSQAELFSYPELDISSNNGTGTWYARGADKFVTCPLNIPGGSLGQGQ